MCFLGAEYAYFTGCLNNRVLFRNVCYCVRARKAVPLRRFCALAKIDRFATLKR